MKNLKNRGREVNILKILFYNSNKSAFGFMANASADCDRSKTNQKANGFKQMSLNFL